MYVTNYVRVARSLQVLGWQSDAFAKDEHVLISEYCLAFLCLLLSSLLIQFYVGMEWKWKYLPEAGAIILMGFSVGGLVYLIGLSSSYQVDSSSHSMGGYYLGFNSNIFYFALLPPIIFNSGYHIKRRFFFLNYDAILSLALVGTAISISIMTCAMYLLQSLQPFNGILNSFSSLEFLAFASLLSSTDPVSTLAVFSSLKVEPLLFYLVLGESILNDSIAIIIFKISAKYISSQLTGSLLAICAINVLLTFVGSALIGYTIGILLAVLYRYVTFTKHIVISIAVFLIVVYLPFFLSETLQLSGVVSILYTGIAARRYITKNITHHEKYMISFLTQFLACIAETTCFALLGVSMFNLLCMSAEWIATAGLLSACVLLLCQLCRAVHVYPLMALVNIVRYTRRKAYRKHPNITDYQKSALAPQYISLNNCHMIFLSGLRGAVAFALANIFPNDHGNRSTVVVVTSVVIFATVFFQGGLTETFISFFNIPMHVDMSSYLKQVNMNEARLALDWERKYLYPLVVRPTAHYEQTNGHCQKRSSSPTSSGGGTLYDGNHEQKEFEALSNPGSPSAKLSIEILTPKSRTRVNDWADVFSDDDRGGVCTPR